jgi:hypothetical protein
MDVLTHGSFPRSGNHLLDTILKFSYPSCTIKWIEHNAWLSLKEKNFICVVRDPLMCAASWIALSQDSRENRSEMILNWYSRYHSFMMKNNNAVLINFDDLIKNPSMLNDIIYFKFNIKNSLEIPNDYYLNHMSIIHPDNYPKGNSDQKNILINEIKKSSEYKNAKKIYKNILKRTVNEF